MKEVLLKHSISKLVLDWNKNNKIALITAAIICELAFYLIIFTFVGFNHQYFTHLVNSKAVGAAWLISAQTLLLYSWIFFYAIVNQNKIAENKYIELIIVALYLAYITYLFYIIGIASIFTGVALVATVLAAASLLKNKIVWYSFLIETTIIVFLSFSPYYSFSLPIAILNDVDQTAIGFSLFDYSFFWTSFYHFLAIPKALLGVLACLYLYSNIRNKLKTAQYSASYDELTRVKNRRFIMNYLFSVAYDKDGDFYESQSTSAQDVSVVIVDLDYFKVINDTYGHLSGDLVLIEVAKRLTESMLRDLWQASRYGGEEFLIVLPEMPHNAAMQAAKHIHDVIRCESIAIVDDLNINVTSSMGVATLSHDEIVGMREYYKVNIDRNGTNSDKSSKKHSVSDEIATPKTSNYEGLIIERLINMADEALYEAKRNGRDQVKSAHNYVDEASAKFDRERNMNLADIILDELDIEIGL